MAETRIGDEFTGLPMSELIGKQDDCLAKAEPELHCHDNAQVPEDADKDIDCSEDNIEHTACQDLHNQQMQQISEQD